MTFPNTPNCSFYQWSKQMFLWLTSPAPPSYGGGGLIVDSPAFFDVSPPAVDGSRTFLPHSAGFVHPLTLRAAQPGAAGLQLIFDKSGRPLQVKPAERGARPIVLNAAGQQVEVAHARLERNRKVILLDQNGKVIQPRPFHVPESKTSNTIERLVTAQKFIIDGIRLFIDPSLAVVDVEQGQAQDSAVLEAQTTAGGSLVYYATMVNDVYAYYATGVKDHMVTLNDPANPCLSPGATCFPTTQNDLDKITAFATGHTTFPDPDALAVEVKSAWVEAAGLPNLSSYLTMTATIPTYDQSSSTTWTQNGQKTVQLALVGMHVVGSTAGHPEMIWATFEHVANAPSAPYSYINTGGSTVPVTPNVAMVPVIGGVSVPWVFAATNASSFNVPHMSFSPPNQIVASSPFSISPSDTMRWKAFGAASDVAPNPIDTSIAASNTEIISINNSIGGMLPSGDVRNNYVMTGATWTIGGAPPNAFIGGNQVGTSSLANTTMETYQQGNSTQPTHQAGGTNCFSCHSSNSTDVSHVFSDLKPLF